MNESSTISGALKKLFRQPSFLIAAGILLISAISLNAATEFMQLYFQKNPVPMREEFTTIPAHLGHWVEISKDEKLTEDMEHVLAATKYLYRDYVDDRLVPANTIQQFEGKSFNERKQMMAQLQQTCPQAVLNVGVTYYTGMVDTVAHIPDRCYIADGFEPTSYKVVTWSAFDNRPGRDEHQEDARYINFEDQVASRKSTARNVAYFFHANGNYTCDPIGVRVLLQNLKQRYAYYAKIELMMQMDNPQLSADQMNDFLTSALPEIERCLPDWKQVTEMAAKKK
jgi:hypothetical protein